MYTQRSLLQVGKKGACDQSFKYKGAVTISHGPFELDLTVGFLTCIWKRGNKTRDYLQTTITHEIKTFLCCENQIKTVISLENTKPILTNFA